MKGDHFTNMETLNANHRCKGTISKSQKTIDHHRGLGIISQLTTHNRDRLGASHNNIQMAKNCRRRQLHGNPRE